MGSEFEFNIKKYAILAVGYILSRLREKELKCVNSVMLFGSTARENATQESDIDLFFDVELPKSTEKTFRARLNKIAGEFYLSNIDLEYKMNGISNEISITVGRLREWDQLNRSISSEGMVLYGKYTAKPSKTKAYTILSWEKPGKAKGALLNKIYGYKIRGKRYPGILEKFGGTKLGHGTIMVPAEYKDIFISVLEKYKVNYSRREVWE